MKITHIKSRLLIGDNQVRLEVALMQLESEGHEVLHVVNNMGGYSLLGMLFALFVPLKIYTIISK